MAMFYTWIYHCQRFLYVSEFGCGFGDVDFMVPLGSEYLLLTGYRWANFKPRGTAFLELNYAGEACGKIRKPTR